jgi:hypothetical protein
MILKWNETKEMTEKLRVTKTDVHIVDVWVTILAWAAIFVEYKLLDILTWIWIAIWTVVHIAYAYQNRKKAD